jgi:hypothetical protein
MRSMQWQLGILGTISAFALRHRETKKNVCRDGLAEPSVSLLLFSQQNPSFHSEQFREMVHGVSNDLINVQQYKLNCYSVITKVCTDITF